MSEPIETGVVHSGSNPPRKINRDMSTTFCRTSLAKLANRPDAEAAASGEHLYWRIRSHYLGVETQHF